MDRIAFYLIFKKPTRYATPTVRLTKGCPSLDRKEIAMKIKMELPGILFEQPQLEANISVEESSIVPKVIAPETIKTIQDSIEQSSGIRLEIVQKQNELKDNSIKD